MKNMLFTLSCMSLLVSGCVITDTGTRTEQAPAAAYGSSDEPFPVLNAYGNWFDVGIYGRVWQPAVMSDWRPYTLGQWVWTDRGWMWDSDEPFGWVVYHYGYWTQLGALGWVWVPGNDWSPARVNWYSSNDYVGWAPMCPPQASYPDAYQAGYENYWTVVPAPQFTRLNVGAYRTTPPPPPRTPPSTGSRGTAVQRPPDIITIQGATHELIPARKTEQDQVRVGRRTVSRVRVDQGDRPAPPSPVYVSPARPDAPPPAPSPITIPGGARIAPRPSAPAVVAPPPVQERTPSPVRITPTPAPGGISPVPAPVRTAPPPQPVRAAPTPAPVRTMPAPAVVSPAPAPVRVAPAPAPARVAPAQAPAKAPDKKNDRR
ncbi:MAG TPA: DUF6600 domain-containing protein [Bacteroidota bacterium]|nr:DUF6600 domain-containing protein [Bacteroidota bacterium]